MSNAKYRTRHLDTGSGAAACKLCVPADRSTTVLDDVDCPHCIGTPYADSLYFRQKILTLDEFARSDPSPDRPHIVRFWPHPLYQGEWRFAIESIDGKTRTGSLRRTVNGRWRAIASGAKTPAISLYADTACRACWKLPEPALLTQNPNQR